MRHRAIALPLAVWFVTANGCDKKKVEELKEGARAALEKVAEGAKAVGHTIAEGARVAGEKIVEGAKATAEAVKTGAKWVYEKGKKVGEKIAEGATHVAEKVADFGSDAWITTKIKANLGVSKLFAIGVKTENGVVTLSGDVKSVTEKETAEKEAKGVSGVKEVKNLLVVKP